MDKLHSVEDSEEKFLTPYDIAKIFLRRAKKNKDVV